MYERAIRVSVQCAWGFLLLAGVGFASAEDAPPKVADPAPMNTELVRTGLYLISGGGANSLLRFSANGMLLVDAKSPGNYRPLMAQVRRTSKLSDMSLRVVILTSAEPEHAGDQAQLAAAKVQVVAQRNAIRDLSASPTADGQPAPKAFAFDHAYTLGIGGVQAQLKHVGRARTDGDTIVYFPDLKVVAVGDLYSSAAPVPDYAASGSWVGWGPALAQVLQLDFDSAVPATGPIVDRASVEAFKSKIDTLVSRARELVAQGCAESELMARLKTDDLGWHIALTGDALHRFHAELRDDSAQAEARAGNPPAVR